jgi:hypothetical protein
VERSHLTDKQEFYQLLDYKDDVDLHEKLEEWERFYSLHRPHSAHAVFSNPEMRLKMGAVKPLFLVAHGVV